MATLTVPVHHAREGAVLLAEFRIPHWYAVQTRANHQMRVQEQLELRTVENYLPVYESVRRWKDRRVRLEVPLFSVPEKAPKIGSRNLATIMRAVQVASSVALSVAYIHP